MSMDITIEDHSKEILEAAEDAWATGLEAIGLTAEAYAKKLCPVDTGRLRNSITHATSTFAGVDQYKDNNEVEYLGGAARKFAKKNEVVIGTNVEYAKFVESGTSKMSPRPFIAPAVKEHGDEYKALMKAAMENA